MSCHHRPNILSSLWLPPNAHHITKLKVKICVGLFFNLISQTYGDSSKNGVIAKVSNHNNKIKMAHYQTQHFVAEITLIIDSSKISAKTMCTKSC